MKTVFAICLVLLSANFVHAQCVGNGCFVYYDAPYVTNVTPTVYYTLINQGVEKSRFYIKAQSDGKMYSIPVINGNMPEIIHKSSNELILDYAAKISYTNKFGGEYVKYVPVEDSHGSTNSIPNKPSAVKHQDAPKQNKLIKTDQPSGVKSPDNSKANLGAPVKTEIKQSQGIDRNSDKEIDDLLRRPSSVEQPKSKIIPRY